MSLSIQNDPKENLNTLDDEFKNIHRNSVNWSELPPIALETIYTYLNRTDQLYMSLVCKAWSNEHGSPKVWRKITYNLLRTTQTEISPEVKIARKFGCMFKYVEISHVGERLGRSTVIKAMEQLQLFLEALIESQCKLFSLVFKNMHMVHQFLSNDAFANLVNCTINFVRTQNTLRIVEFHHTFYKQNDAAKILAAVCESNSRTLMKLVLQGFSRDAFDEVDIPMSPPHLLSTPNMTNLTTLKVDYSQFFEESMQQLLDIECLETQLMKKLLLIDVLCEGSLPAPIKGISPLVWKSLRKMCPQLRINMNILYQTQIQNDLTIYLVNHIPLQHLVLNLKTNLIGTNLNIDVIFQQICNCRAHDFLESLSIYWMPAVGDISRCFIPFLQVTKKLKAVQMGLRYPVTGIEAIFEYLLNHQPESLESICITVTGVDDEVIQRHLMEVADEICPVLQVTGLTAILLIYS